ncbi:hypothetical protein V1279_003005 [Bradyrhizobium sp. AZCC 1610]|uniref:DUF6197 family protein n=1 Tax=Bradyrhizobium sp. AZCC 1610 TaxID=3117020 RepID=UPI002FF2B59F
MRKISETLIAARAIIADPAHWTKHAHARDAAGEPVTLDAPNATCFCLDGAIAKASDVHIDAFGHWVRDEHYFKTSEFLRGVLQEASGKHSYVAVNDGSAYCNDETGHPGVLALLDLGIEKAKQAEEVQS